MVHEKGVILTKNNLARRNWNGSKVCCFCNNLETTQHLFFDRHYACFLWCAVYWVFGITSPTSVSHLFGEWSKLGRRKHNLLVLTGASTLCWAIWLTRNDFAFNKRQNKLFCKYCSRGHIGSDSGLNCNTWMSTRLSLWSLEQCLCLLLMGGVSLIVLDIRLVPWFLFLV